MPALFRFNGIRSFFFPNEGDRREPLQIHAQRAECLAKIWLHPGIALADNHGFAGRSGACRQFPALAKAC
jgi:hypothetical protein